jgi:hypothetical protein
MNEAEHHRLLGSIEAKLDHLIEAQRIHAEQHAETEKRLRVLEQGLTRTQTIGSAIAFMITTLATVFPTFWSKH